MEARVVALRDHADFKRAGALPPESLAVTYCAPDDARLPALMKQAAALVLPAVGPKLPPALFEGSTIKLAQVTGAGVDRLDRAALTRLGIPVANVPGGSNAAVAEYVVTAAAMLLRRFAWADYELKAGNYEQFRLRLLRDNVGGIEGSTIGVVGLGTIGFAVAKAFKDRGADIVYFDMQQRTDDEVSAIQARYQPLSEVLRISDVVTIHVPLLPTTAGMIGMTQFAMMKPGAIFINASRGGVVDEQALISNLQSGHLGGAAVDVYAVEPPSAKHPFFTLSGDTARRVLLTPHIAGVTRQSSSYLLRTSWQNVERVLRGQEPLNRVY